MSQAADMQVLGVFDDRAALETAIGKLQGQGIGRDRLTVLGTEEAMRRHLGVEVGQTEGGEAAGSPADGVQEQRSVENLAPIVGGIPLYAGALLAAGATVASGGTLAVAAAAALAGGAGGGALGLGAVAALHKGTGIGPGTGDAGGHADRLQKGGVALLVNPRAPEDLETARRVLAQEAERTVEQPVGGGSGA